jgi:hypothetical protein
MEVPGAAASSSSGSRSTSLASSRASALARAAWAPMPARPRAAIVAQVLSARKGLVCWSPYSANVPTGVSVSKQLVSPPAYDFTRTFSIRTASASKISAISAA